ncbi:MAG: hypothetical protein IKZ64_01625 [Alphaproteobacteria bacterium]|nr:hypothetical protein [Alphaproteobacteria bacterium]
MRIYLIIAILCIVGGAYLLGAQVAQRKCELRAAQNQTNEIIQTISIQRKTDEKVYNTGVHDIRRILHTKYTIAE